MKVAFAKKDVETRPGSGNKLFPKEGAILHKQRGALYYGGVQLKCRRSTNRWGYGNASTGMETSHGPVPDDFDPRNGKPDFSLEEQARRFLMGIEEVPDWVFQYQVCTKCWKQQTERVKCNYGHYHDEPVDERPS